jgi:hypothetical protein
MAEGFNHWLAIAEALDKECQEIAVDTAAEAKKNIKQRITANGQVQTGFMRDGIYTVSRKGSDYTGGKDALPPIAKPTSKYAARYAAAARYSIHQNNGTRYIPPRPFFGPGTERTRPYLDARMAGIEEKLRGAK